MARTTWILGNWKQNHGIHDAADCARTVYGGLDRALDTSQHTRVGIAPSYLSLAAVAPFSGYGPRDLVLAAQDVGAQEFGAFTGEVGPAMLLEADVQIALVGHSERRSHFGDTNTIVQNKLDAALHAGLNVVLCVGENLDDRESGTHENVIISQLSDAFRNVSNDLNLDRIIIAYEPVWAIGTGRSASPSQANDMHCAIRGWLHDERSAFCARRSVIYGGSVKPANAAALIDEPEIDGFLVGGASLDAPSFLAIVAAAARSEIEA